MRAAMPAISGAAALVPLNEYVYCRVGFPTGPNKSPAPPVVATQTPHALNCGMI